MKKLLQKLGGYGPSLLFQTGFVSLSKIDTQSSDKLSGIFGSGDLTTFVQKLFVFALSVGAILAVVQLMYAGYLYMGSDMWSSKGKAREIFVNVITGILLLLSIWLILKVINPQLLNLDVLSSIKKTPATGLAAPAGSGGPPYQCPTQCPVYCDPSTAKCL